MTGESYSQIPGIRSRTLLEPDSASVRKVAEVMGRAFEDPGFFVLGLDADGAVCQAALNGWKQFVALPEAVKQSQQRSVEVDGVRGGFGLMRDAPVYMSHMDEHERTAAVPKQQFGCSADEGATLWPSEDVCPGFSPSVQSCLREVDRAARAVMSAFERVLGRPDGFIRYASGYLTLTTYPGQPGASGPGPEDYADEGERSLGLHEHSDAGVFTMLTQSERALQLKTVDGRWSTVPVLGGNEVVVIPGDWMELWTNGAIPAVRHRVIDTPYDRSSISYFQGVARMPIGPLPAFVSADNPARYPNVNSDIPYTDGEAGVPRWRTAPDATPGEPEAHP